jgi:archaellum component FlaG (FlaF/FlaG flagellin family)
MCRDVIMFIIIIIIAITAAGTLSIILIRYQRAERVTKWS